MNSMSRTDQKGTAFKNRGIVLLSNNMRVPGFSFLNAFFQTSIHWVPSLQNLNFKRVGWRWYPNLGIKPLDEYYLTRIESFYCRNRLRIIYVILKS